MSRWLYGSTEWNDELEEVGYDEGLLLVDGSAIDSFINDYDDFISANGFDYSEDNEGDDGVAASVTPATEFLQIPENRWRIRLVRFMLMVGIDLLVASAMLTAIAVNGDAELAAEGACFAMAAALATEAVFATLGVWARMSSRPDSVE